jgi:uncharacterized SAM-binding protein YcdF (DUF218 family)
MAPDASKGRGAHDKSRLTLRRAARSVWRSLKVIGLIGVLALLIGFFWFAWKVPVGEVAPRRNADGIVVLTGGASRIADAIELLASKRGKRLLISGVHPATTAGEIARLVPEYGSLLNCCVDIDHSVNTVGNAMETRRWVKERGFHSLVVVTSSYHMPRTMLELAHQMPDIALVPFPVITDKMRAEPWWSSGSTARLLISEYLKYIVAQIRIRLVPVSVVSAFSGGRVSVRN